MRIVDAKNVHALRDPIVEDALDLFPQCRCRRRRKIERINVLVFLRRILRVLNASVGASPEPLRMLLDVGMVGRALQRDIERDVDAELPCCGHEPPEIVQRPQRRMDRLVPALFGADRPRAARIVGGRHERVIAALALDASDWMDRRKIQNVEAQRRDARQQGFAVGERAVPAPGRTARARKHLVPAGKARAFRLDDDRERRFERGRRATIRMRLHQQRELVAERQLAAGGKLAIGRQHARDLAQALRCSCGGALRGVLHQRRPGLQRQRNIGLVRGTAPDEVVAPGQERVDPRRDLVFVAAELGHDESGAPAIVAERSHRRLEPVASAGAAVPEQAAQLVMTVGKYVGFDHHRLARRAFDREPPVIDPRLHVFDDDRPQAVIDFQRRTGCGVLSLNSSHQLPLKTTTPSGGSVALIE